MRAAARRDACDTNILSRYIVFPGPSCEVRQARGDTRSFDSLSHRTTRGSAAAAVGSHQLRLGEDVPAHGVLHLALPCSRGKLQRSIQGVELEEIAMSLAGRRARAAVAALA